MIENLKIDVHCVSDNCFSVQVFGRILEVITRYDEVEEWIEEFCEEWNVDTCSLIVNEI